MGDGVVRVGRGTGGGGVGVPVVAGPLGRRPDQGAVVGSGDRAGRIRDWRATASAADAVLPSGFGGGQGGGVVGPRHSGRDGS